MKDHGVDKFLADFNSTPYSYLYVSKDYSSEALEFLSQHTKKLNYYKREGLLPSRAKKSNFSFLELVWIKIIFDLKEMGIQSKPIVELKNVLFESIDSGQIYAAYKSKENEIDAYFKDLSPEARELIKSNFEEAFKGSNHSTIQFSKFYSLIAYLLIYKAPVEIRFFSNGEVRFYDTDGKFEFDINFVNTLLPNHKSFFAISLIEVINFFIGKGYMNPILKDSLLSKDEQLILKTIKEEKPKSITVEFNKENKIDLIKVKKEKTIDISQRLSEIFIKNAYEEVTITTQKGNIVNCTKTKKIKPFE
jgi:DNA-binding transcriptional MerR regulator